MKARVASVNLDLHSQDIRTNAENIKNAKNEASLANKETLVKLDQNLTQYNGGGRVFYNDTPDNKYNVSPVEGDVIWTFSEAKDYKDAVAYKYTQTNKGDMGYEFTVLDFNNGDNDDETNDRAILPKTRVVNNAGDLAWVKVPSQQDIFAGQMHGGKITGAEIEGATFHGTSREDGLNSPYSFYVDTSGNIHGASLTGGSIGIGYNSEMKTSNKGRDNIENYNFRVYYDGTLAIGGDGSPGCPFFVTPYGNTRINNLNASYIGVTDGGSSQINDTYGNTIIDSNYISVDNLNVRNGISGVISNMFNDINDNISGFNSAINGIYDSLNELASRVASVEASGGGGEVPSYVYEAPTPQPTSKPPMPKVDTSKTISNLNNNNSQVVQFEKSSKNNGKKKKK